MNQKKIEELRKRLDKLEGKEKEQTEKPMGSLGSSFEEMGKGFREIKESMPKVKLGKNKPKQPIQYDPRVNKARGFLFWALTILVGGLATILILVSIIKRFV